MRCLASGKQSECVYPVQPVTKRRTKLAKRKACEPCKYVDVAETCFFTLTTDDSQEKEAGQFANRLCGSDLDLLTIP